MKMRRIILMALAVMMIAMAAVIPANAAHTHSAAKKVYKVESAAKHSYYSVCSCGQQLTGVGLSGWADHTFNSSGKCTACGYVKTTIQKTNMTIFVGGKKVSFPDQQPVVVNNRTLVPVRFIAENLGYKVDWDSAENTAVIDGGRIKIYINSDQAEINGKKVTLDVKSEAINNRTMVPLRVVSETLGCTVDWVPSNNYVLVNKRNADGSEMSVFERLKQTGLFWVIETETTEDLIPKTVKATLADYQKDSWCKWRIVRGKNTANMVGADRYDCTINMNTLDKTTIKEVENLFPIIYPTQYTQANDLLMKTLKAELWECYMPEDSLFYDIYEIANYAGTFGTRYLDNREFEATRDMNCTSCVIGIYKEGTKNEMIPRKLTTTEIEWKKSLMSSWDIFYGNS